MTHAAAPEARTGLYAGLGAYLMWGAMPLYLKLFDDISAAAVLAHRIFWSAVLLGIVIVAARRLPALRAAVIQPRLLLWLGFSATMIGLNWYIYTWAILNDRVLDTSLGYFIQPLLNTILGTLFLGDRLGTWGAVATVLAAFGIAVATIAAGGLPLIALGLAGAFALYSLARNRAAVDAVTGLFIETLALAPVALWYLYAFEGGIFGEDAATTALLMLAGVVTSVPLALFGYAARRLTLTAIGFLQYIAPSTVFLLAVFLYDEPLDLLRLGAFLFIWSGLLVFSVGGLRQRRTSAKAA
ncbi:MAG: EamA family transporter RarD [Pseudomonadota bacterium]